MNILKNFKDLDDSSRHFQLEKSGRKSQISQKTQIAKNQKS